jgi:hypothetical protein
VDQSLPDTPTQTGGDARAFEGSLKALWDRAKRAVEVIAELREQKQVQMQRIGELEAEVRRLQQEVARRDATIKATATEHAAKPAHGLVDESEREALAQKVQDLILKIEAYL